MRALLREAIASAVSQVVASVLTIAMACGMCVAVLSTTGRTVAAEQAVLARVDAAGTRSIVISARPEAGLTVGLLDVLAAFDQVESAVGLGPIADARNPRAPEGPKVALRHGYGTVGSRHLHTLQPVNAGARAIASHEAIRSLGLHSGTGGVVTEHGEHVTIVGELSLPSHLRFLGPVVIVPASSPDSQSGVDPEALLAMLVILVSDPHAVAPVEATVRDLVDSPSPGAVTIDTSSDLAAVRAAIDGELSSHRHATVLAILAITGLLLTVNLLGLVAMRRRDFGRRRALGATRSLIVRLLIAQTVLLAGLGAAIGTVGVLVWITLNDDPVPGAQFAVAVAVTATLTAAVAAVPPAVIAARRDPLHELRVP